jgi:hypothetical protein
MGDAEANSDFPNRDQRFAVCNSLWEGRKTVSTKYEEMLAAAKRGVSVGEILAGNIPPEPSFERVVTFSKNDEMLQIAYAEVYTPNVPDSHGDFMRSDEIRKMAHDFLARGLTKNVDVEHDNELRDCAIVESFIAREGDPDFIPGSWVAGVHIADPELWDQVRKGEINGFSLQGVGMTTPSQVEIDVPSDVKGLTVKSEGDEHWHAFSVRFDDAGNFIGGTTIATFPEGAIDHVHAIKHGTITEPYGEDDANHTHRFSFVEGLNGTLEG